ncbi:MAG: hypothetical protein V4725_11630 [Bacteroidota bacterium]
MALNKTTPVKSNSLKKKMMTEVSIQLSTSLTSLKEALGSKKFDKRIKKAAKLLTSGIKDPEPTKAPVKKAPLKKASLKKAPLKKAAAKKQAKPAIKSSKPKSTKKS